MQMCPIISKGPKVGFQAQLNQHVRATGLNNLIAGYLFGFTFCFF
jgi:hypothetical protein